MNAASSEHRNATAAATSSGAAETAERGLRQQLGLQRLGQVAREVGGDEAGGDGIARDAPARDFARGGLGEPDQPGLRRRVVGLARLAGLARHARDVDDAPGARPEHRPQDRLRRVEGAEEVHLEHGAPLVEAHPHDQVVAGDAGVVDQDVEPAEGLDRARDERGSRLRVRHVALDPEAAPAQRLHVAAGRLRGLDRPTVEERDVGALPGQPQHDGAPDAARPAGDDGGLVGQIDHADTSLAAKNGRSATGVGSSATQSPGWWMDTSGPTAAARDDADGSAVHSSTAAPLV